MAQDGVRSEDIDTSRPHPARIYDYLLGGKDNYEVDQQAGDALVAAAPEVRIGRAGQPRLPAAAPSGTWSAAASARSSTSAPGCPPRRTSTRSPSEIGAGRARRVRRQRPDRERARRRAAQRLRHDQHRRSPTCATRRPSCDHPDVRQVIDFDEPVALLLGRRRPLPHRRGEAGAVVATLRDALPAGSFLVLSHATGDFADRSDAQAVYSKATAALNLRSHAEVERFFDGFELVEPGLAQAPFWRPDSPPPPRSREIGFYGGVGRKTG